MGTTFLEHNQKNTFFNEGDLYLGLDQEIGPFIEVGCGNALLISGWCFHTTYQVIKINIIFNNQLYMVNHLDIMRPDLAEKFPEYKHLEQCGFWHIIPIEEIKKAKTSQLTMVIELGDKSIKNILISNLELSPTQRNNDLNQIKESVKKIVSKIKICHSKPHVLICLASFNPEKELFKNQINSIKNQTYSNWCCIINDDCSERSIYEWMTDYIKDDERFIIARNNRNLGFYNNFEKLMYLIPDNTDFIALADQDDLWHSNKIEQLVEAFDDETTLVYSDMKIVDKNGNTISNTFWTTRRNYYEELDYLILVNTITGAASMFRRSIIKYLIPFPTLIGTSYHDHWIGCVANALGRIKYIEKPLYDYYQHGNNVLGQAVFQKQCLSDRIKHMHYMLTLNKIKLYLIHYHQVFNKDGIRLILIASNLMIRIPQMRSRKKNEIRTFYSLGESSWRLYLMSIKTIFNGKTTQNAERVYIKAYLADKVIRTYVKFK